LQDENDDWKIGIDVIEIIYENAHVIVNEILKRKVIILKIAWSMYRILFENSCKIHIMDIKSRYTPMWWTKLKLVLHIKRNIKLLIFFSISKNHIHPW